jgi:hypothetical protein
MTLRAIAGLLAFNVFVLAVGAGVLWGLRGWRWWTELVRLAGVAYFLGVAALMVLTMLELVLGIPVDLVTVALTGVGVVVAGIGVGRRRGFAAPGFRAPEWRFPRISVLAALFLAGIVVYFESLLRAARLAGVAREWDSWANWLPKSKSLYLSERLDLEFLAVVPQLTSYPPGHTSIQALAFHAMGSPDTVTLHLQYAFMAIFFAAAVIGLLAGRVRDLILFPVLLAFLVARYLLDWLTTVYADLPMGYLIALAALLVFLWIDERQSWHLAAATLLLSGAMLTKREGMLFAVCVLFAGLAASLGERRRAWPRLVAAGLIAFALVLPWRIWYTSHGIASVGPDTGYDGHVSDLDRLWPAFEITLRSLVHPDLWHFAAVLAVAAIVLALLAGAWRISLYTAAFLVASVGAVTWILWVNHGLTLIHEDWAIRRFVGTPMLVLAALTPLLLQRAWSPGGVSGSSDVGGRLGVLSMLHRPTSAAWAIVLVGLLSHPGSALVGYPGSGLPGGWPSFPGTAGCDARPEDGAGVRLVVGYADSYREATSLRERTRQAGLAEVETSQDGCGRLRVYVDDVPTAAAARELASDAQAAGLTPTLEHDPDE